MVPGQGSGGFADRPHRCRPEEEVPSPTSVETLDGRRRGAYDLSSRRATPLTPETLAQPTSSPLRRGRRQLTIRAAEHDVHEPHPGWVTGTPGPEEVGAQDHPAGGRMSLDLTSRGL